MKNEARLAAIMKQIDFKGLSRNKNFDTFKDPLVRDARDRLNRLHRLAAMLSGDESIDWDAKLSGARDRQGLWTLTCRSRRSDARWVARLHDFELEILRHYSRSAAIRP
ncbi:MAG: hypothetical protein QNK37_27225 [Acidobacteriota bacterium]|nr:hypothetical protein [Acidobacteriota bacterium]